MSIKEDQKRRLRIFISNHQEMILRSAFGVHTTIGLPPNIQSWKVTREDVESILHEYLPDYSAFIEGRTITFYLTDGEYSGWYRDHQPK